MTVLKLRCSFPPSQRKPRVIGASEGATRAAASRARTVMGTHANGWKFLATIVRLPKSFNSPCRDTHSRSVHVVATSVVPPICLQEQHRPLKYLGREPAPGRLCAGDVRTS
jgi:hypothetical protein